MGVSFELFRALRCFSGTVSFTSVWLLLLYFFTFAFHVRAVQFGKYYSMFLQCMFLACAGREGTLQTLVQQVLPCRTGQHCSSLLLHVEARRPSLEAQSKHKTNRQECEDTKENDAVEKYQPRGY